MQKTAIVALALVFLLASGAASASEALVKKNNCLACHHMTDKKPGPTWKAIAAKNKDLSDAEKILAEASYKGGKGKYGVIPMPPLPKAQKDAVKIAKWILTL